MLAAQLRRYAGRTDVLVLALPRGGVPVAFEVARRLDAPLDVFTVRKLGVPGHEELAMGAVASGGVLALNQDLVRLLRISADRVAAVAARERRELGRREAVYRGGRPPLRLTDRTVILVDDGMATGSSMRAAVTAARRQRPAAIVVAVPVAAVDTCRELRAEVADLVCPVQPERFYSVGLWYDDFAQTSDEEVRALLGRAAMFGGSGKEDAMALREIPESEWREYCAGFSVQHQGWLVTAAVEQAGGERQELWRELPLEEVRSEGEPGAAVIGIRAGDQALQVPRPRRLLFEETAEGAHAGLRIESDTGVVAAIRFRTPARPELVDGVPGAGASRRQREERAVQIPVGAAMLQGDLVLPEGARGLVLFAHGSGSSRLSPRNRHVARSLNREGLGTLLMDLLTEDEEAIDARTAGLRFDIALLAGRLIGAARWLQQRAETARLRIGCFGASTGAAAALVAAAELPDMIAAIVSRGGRPDLAGPALGRVRAPTLLIVGGADVDVLRLNRAAAAALAAENQLAIVPGASHLFEEPGALDQVARLAGAWFTRYL